MPQYGSEKFHFAACREQFFALKAKHKQHTAAAQRRAVWEQSERPPCGNCGMEIPAHRRDVSKYCSRKCMDTASRVRSIARHGPRQISERERQAAARDVAKQQRLAELLSVICVGRSCRVCGAAIPLPRLLAGHGRTALCTVQCRTRERERKKRALGKGLNRRAKERFVTPRWLTAADRKKTRAKYAQAKHATKATGVRHEVDHMVPLNGENVCGLHVPWNLRVIPWRMNQLKSNNVLPEVPQQLAFLTDSISPAQTSAICRPGLTSARSALWLH